MKAGSFGQELTLAAELLADAENLIARAGLTSSSRDLLDLAQSLSKARSELATMLPAKQPHGGNENLTARRSMDPMKIALRVLTAHANGAKPDESDLNALERIYGEKPAPMSWDIFACEAIQNVLKDRASARKWLTLGTASR
jgi:hypothetical protein